MIFLSTTCKALIFIQLKIWCRACLFTNESKFINQYKELIMNSDRIEGNWKELKGKAQQKRGDLTNDDLKKIEGSLTELVGKFKQKYGKSKKEAEREVNSFKKSH